MQYRKYAEKTSLPLLSLCAVLLANCGGSSNNTTPAPASESGLDQRPANATCIAPPRPGSGGGMQLDLVYPNLTFTQPVALLRAPGDNTRWFVVQQNGSVVTFANDNTTSTQSTFVDLTGLVSGGTGEDGLLGMAFHPQYASNRQVFLSYTRPGTASFPLVSYISRFTANAAGSALSLASEQPILTVNQPYTNHNGGHIAFSPKEPYLYIGLGDGGSGGDPDNNAQNPDTLLGKILRIDVDSAAPYGIPADNPFAAGGGAGAIYALGLRNPWRWSFDRTTGDLWLGDVGQNTWEEVDKITRGGNYGWRIREGMHCFNPTNCTLGTLIDPVAEYTHDDGACSITGGFVYRGTLLADLQDTYVYGDYCNGKIWGINVKTPGATSRLLIDTPYNISAFGEDENGELYVVSHANGKLYRLAPATAPAPGLASKLSDSGCVDRAHPALPAVGLIPYDVNVPFWSDGADKSRWLALPDNTTITIGSDGDWTFPIGTVFVKHFRLGGKLVETRLFMRHPDGEWAGYSYEWNAAETDASLLTTGKVSTINGQSWLFPSGDQCLQCHTAAAGRALGPETAQMNRTFAYPTGRSVNQIATFAAINLFSAPPPSATSLPALPPLSDTTAPLGARARAYLHSNCSVCHRPGGTGQGPMDFRYSTADANINVCNVQPTQGDLGITGARLLLPGNPAQSIISVRMHRLDDARMPPVASSVVDDQGTALIDAWITGLNACPN